LNLDPAVDLAIFAKSLAHKQERECLWAPNRNCSAVG
jgi:hypothetical protein